MFLYWWKTLQTFAKGRCPKVGQVGLDENDDVVEGIIVMRKGEKPAEVLSRVKAKIARSKWKDSAPVTLNGHLLWPR